MPDFFRWKFWGRNTHRIFAFLIAVVMGCCLFIKVPMNARASEEWKTVRVSVGINKALYLNEDGEPEGYCSEYLIQLAKINHWKLEYVEGSWNESVQNLYDGKIDLLLPTQMTEERKEKMGFSSSIGGYQPIGLFAAKDSDYCYDDYAKFNGLKIAVSEGTSNEVALQQYARENNFSYTAVYIDSVEEKVNALADGTVDLVVFSTLNDIEAGKVVAMLDYLPFYYCTNINDTELLKELNYGMNQMLIRNPELVQEVFYDFMNRNISFAYTVEEKAAITEKGKIVVGVYQDTPPLFEVAGDGSFSGIYVDLIQRVEELSGLDIEIKALDRKELIFDYLNNGSIDFVLDSSDQALKYESNEAYVQSEDVMDYYTIAVSRPDFSASVDNPMVFALTTGRQFWAEQIFEKCKEASIKYYPTSKECLEAIKKGDADITLINTWEYNYQSKNSRFQNLIEWETSRVLSETRFIALADSNELIRSVMDKAIEQISNAEKEGIITANLNTPYHDYSLSDKIYSMKEGIIIFICVILLLLITFFVYITMRKRNIQALEKSNERLEQANEAKDLFMSRMSHELRTPLNAINGYTTVVEQNISDPDFDVEMSKTNLESIHRAVKYQLAIIGDLLDIQKIESGKLELNKTVCQSEEYIKNIIDMIMPEADRKNIHFSYQALSPLNETYMIDGIRFQQVLLNLLHNAVKFTQEGGSVKLTSEVIDQTQNNHVLKFVISDNGIGMSEDFQKNYLFKKFAQEYSGTTSPYEGCGTGLALSQEIMHMMGGEITCESQQGIGSTFTITVTAQHRIRSRRTAKKIDYQQYDLKGLNILLCEDNMMNQDMERRLLEKMNAVVDIADDGMIGLEKFENSDQEYYDVILMDIRMPNMDGWECTKNIRSLEREDAKTVPIIAVSANAFEEDIEHSAQVGMSEHLSKPVDVRKLYEKLSEYKKGEQLC